MPAALEPDAARMRSAGLEVVWEHGVLRGEWLGLEVARVGEEGFEVGVGRHDRAANRELYPDGPRTRSSTRRWRPSASYAGPGHAAHPANQLAPERWLRAVAVRHPSLVGARQSCTPGPRRSSAPTFASVPSLRRGATSAGRRVASASASTPTRPPGGRRRGPGAGVAGRPGAGGARTSRSSCPRVTTTRSPAGSRPSSATRRRSAPCPGGPWRPDLGPVDSTPVFERLALLEQEYEDVLRRLSDPDVGVRPTRVPRPVAPSQAARDDRQRLPPVPAGGRAIWRRPRRCTATPDRGPRDAAGRDRWRRRPTMAALEEELQRPAAAPRPQRRKERDRRDPRRRGRRGGQPLRPGPVRDVQQVCRAARVEARGPRVRPVGHGRASTRCRSSSRATGCGRA